eukprot:tig00000342_g24222.t1
MFAAGGFAGARPAALIASISHADGTAKLCRRISQNNTPQRLHSFRARRPQRTFDGMRFEPICAHAESAAAAEAGRASVADARKRLVALAKGRESAGEAIEVYEELRRAGAALGEQEFGSAAWAMARAGDYQRALQVVQEARGAGAGREATVAGMWALGRAGDADGALALLDSLERPDARAFTTALNACAECDPDMGRAERIIERMRAAAAAGEAGAAPTTATYTALARGYGRHGELDAVRALLERFRRDALPLDLIFCNALVAAMCEAGEAPAAEAVLQTAQAAGLQADAVTYGTLARGYAMLGDEGAPSLASALARMRAAGLPPTPAFFNGIIDAAARTGRAALGLQALDWMRAKGVAPDVVTYNTLMKLHGRARQREAALAVMDELLAGRAEGGLAPTARRPDAVTATALVEAVGRGRLWPRVLAALREAAGAGVVADEGLARAAIIAAFRCREREVAMRIFRDMRGISFRPFRPSSPARGSPTPPPASPGPAGSGPLPLRISHLRPGVRTFNAVLRELGRLGGAGALQVARAVLEDMALRGVAPDEGTVTALLESGDRDLVDAATARILPAGAGRGAPGWDAALESAAQRRGPRFANTACAALDALAAHDIPLRASTYNAILRACGRDSARPLQRADAVVARMRGAGVAPDVETYRELVAISARAGDAQRALALVEEMLAQGVSLGGLDGAGEFEVLRGYMDAVLVRRCLGDDEAPLARLLAEMRADGFDPTAGTFAALIRAFGKARRAERAQEAFDALPSLGLVADEAVYNALVEALRHSGALDSALAVIEEMRALGMSPRSEGLDLLKDYMDSAIEDLEEGMGIRPTLVTFNRLVRDYGRAGDLPSALRVVDQIQRAGLEPDIVTFNTLLDECVKNGREKLAVEIFRDMQRSVDGLGVAAAGGLAQARPDVRTFAIAAKALASLGRLDEAWGLLEEMEAGGVLPDTALFNTLISRSLARGDVDRAMEAFSEMLATPGCEPDIYTFNTLVRGVARIDAREAFALLRTMQKRGIEPDKITMLTLMDACVGAGEMGLARDVLRIASRAGFSFDPDDRAIAALSRSSSPGPRPQGPGPRSPAPPHSPSPL